jgi:hypothetical protein
VNLNGGRNVAVAVFVSEMGFESDWHAVPSERVDLPETVSHTTNDSLGSHTRLLPKSKPIFPYKIKSYQGANCVLPSVLQNVASGLDGCESFKGRDFG